ncbi:MAG: CidA/LrgA family protein [Lachnospiraceae bacterium]|nr:CidA/LrgA family protein [Lachnospiraceae bacterium]
MKYMKQFCIIMGISFFGELLKFILPFPIPASIYGLILMFGALLSGVIPLKEVESAADFLVAIMPMMFIPAGVGLMAEWDSMSGIWLQLLLIIVISTVAVMAVTGRITQWLIRHDQKKGGMGK